jgi:hypothetical protein
VTDNIYNKEELYDGFHEQLFRNKFYVQLFHRDKSVSERKRGIFEVVGYRFSDDGEFQAVVSNNAPMYFTLKSDKWYHKYGILPIKATVSQITKEFGDVVATIKLHKGGIKILYNGDVVIRTRNMQFAVTIIDEEGMCKSRAAWAKAGKGV